MANLTIATAIGQVSKRPRFKSTDGASLEPGFHRQHLGATAVFKRGFSTRHGVDLNMPSHRTYTHTHTHTRAYGQKARPTTLPEGRRQGFQCAIATPGQAIRPEPPTHPAACTPYSERRRPGNYLARTAARRTDLVWSMYHRHGEKTSGSPPILHHMYNAVCR